MSKAFVKEDSEPEEDLEAADLSLPPGTKNYITPAGFERLREEIRRLLYEDRPPLVEKIAWAASNGDRSENADYIYGKRRLREIDRRVGFLNRRLDIAEVVDPKTVKAKKVLFGATVTVAFEDGKKKSFRIVGVDESDPKDGKISWRSPLAQALLTHSASDVVMFRSPAHPQGEEIEILKVEYV